MSPSANRRRSTRARISRRLRRTLRWRWRRPPPARPRIVLGRDDLELHSLVCAQHVAMSLWSLKSFLAFSGLRPAVVLHDDGSLRPSHRRLFERHFEGVRILEDRVMSARMDIELAPWPACRRARRRPDFYCARKLLDLLFVGTAPSLLYVDSDILFFRRPEALLEHVQAGRPCFNADYQDAYGAPHEFLERWAGRDVLRRVNAGLLHVPVAAYRSQLGEIERYFEYAERERAGGDINRHEQTAHALVLSALNAVRLPPAYAIQGDLDASTVSHHFVNDGVQRRKFWTAGVRRLRQEVPTRLRHG